MTRKLSKYALLICYCFMCYAAFVFHPKWERGRTEATLSWDVSGYYMYLPALFIYKDIKHCTFQDSLLSKYYPTPDFQQAFLHEKSGNYIMKYASGQAIMMSPWFCVAHIWASSSDQYLPDGFSLPYQMCIGIGMFLYGLLGLYYLRKILLHYFSDAATAVTLLLLVFGTNYLNFSSIDQGMPHSPLFTLYALVIWNTIRFYQKPEMLRIVWMGLLCGLATLIRPTEIIVLFIPLLWGLSNLVQLKDRAKFIRTNISMVVVFALCFIAVVAVQPIYWKLVANEWLVYSYQDQGFDWLRPHLNKFMFSPRSGWLRYCPMMLLPFIGLYPFVKQKINVIPIVLLIFLSLYIAAAWSIWDYGGNSGRAMIQYYPLLAFPLAALVTFVNDKKQLKIPFYTLALLFIYLNIWWTYHAHAGNIQITNLTKEYYWRVLGQWSSSESDTKLLDNKHSFAGTPKNPTVIYENNFDADTSKNLVNIGGNNKLMLDGGLQYTSKYVIKNPQNYQPWMRTFALFKCEAKEWDTWRQAQFIIRFNLGDKEVQNNVIRIYRFLNDGQEREIFIDAKCPKEWTQATIEIWNAESDKKLLIDDLKVWTFVE